MRAVTRFVLVALAPLAFAACHKHQPQAENQNNAIDQDLLNSGIPANADVETLPPDESTETPSNELVNGADDTDTNGATNNAY